MQDTLNYMGARFLDFAWPMLWQSSLLIVIVFVADLLLARKLRASVRHALWLVVLAKLLLPPTLALPTGAAWWLFPAKPIVEPAFNPVPWAATANTSVVVYDDAPPSDYVPEPVAHLEPPRPQLNRAGWLVLAIGAISLGLLVWLLVRWWQLAQKVRRAAKVSSATTGEGLETPLEQARQLAGLSGNIRLKLVDNQMSPAVCGLFRPVILLPGVLAENLSAAQLRAVLLHELIHLRRCDIWVNCAQSLLQILYWWHPLVWLANARIRQVREEAVDDAVMLALADDAGTYAPTLLEVAKLAFRRPLMSLGIIGLVGIIESRSALRQRVERLVDFRAPRRAGLTILSFFGIFIFSAVALPMGQGPAPVIKAAAVETVAEAAPAQIAPPVAVVESRPPLVTIQAVCCQIPPTALNAVVTELEFHPASTNESAWWSASPEEYAKLQDTLTRSNFTVLTRPRIICNSGQGADFFIGNDTGGTDIDCLPNAKGDQIEFVLHGKITDRTTSQATTNKISLKGLLPNHGGMIVKFPDDTNNTVIFLNVTIQPARHSADSDVRNDVEFQASLHALEKAKGVQNTVEPERTILWGRTENQAHIFPLLTSFPLNQTNQPPMSAGKKVDFISVPSLGLVETIGSATAPESDYLAIHGKAMSFKLEHPLDEESLKNELRAAGVQMPPTCYLYNRAAGVFALHGTPDQLRLASAMVMKLNGHTNPSAPLEFTHRGNSTNSQPEVNVADDSTAYTRTFRVDPYALIHGLENVAPQTSESLGSTNVVAMTKALFSQLGIDFSSPAGKAIFYQDRAGILFVKATLADLDTIERAIQVLTANPPQIHLKIQIVEVPLDKEGNPSNLLTMVGCDPVSFEGVLTAQNARLALQKLKSKMGAATIDGSEITVSSSRRVEIKTGSVETIVTGLAFATNNGVSSFQPETSNIQVETNTIETGPMMSVMPSVLADGYTIDLPFQASLTEFRGYYGGPKSGIHSFGEKNELPPAFPAIKNLSHGSDVNLYDSQSLVISFDPSQANMVTVPALDKIHDAATVAYVKGEMIKVKEHDSKRTFIFITPTIVDAAGARVHSDDELSFAQTNIPPQPTSKDVSALFSIPIKTPNPTNQIQNTSNGRTDILDKLQHILIPILYLNQMTLRDALKALAEQSRKLDPEHRGINFLIDTHSLPAGTPSAVPSIDPTTGLPLTPAGEESSPGKTADIGSSVINLSGLMDSGLKAARLVDVLNAIVLVADRPLKYSVQDFGVVFSVKGPELPQLFMRTFKVNSDAFYASMENPNSSTNLLRNTNAPAYQSTTSAATPSAVARAFFSTLGIDLRNSPGKSVFFNDHLGLIFVKATESDLDIIERYLAVSKVNQDNTPSQNNVKPTGLLFPYETKAFLKFLYTQPDAATLGEPEITVFSGRQTQMRATSISRNYGDYPGMEYSPDMDKRKNLVESAPLLNRGARFAGQSDGVYPIIWNQTQREMEQHLLNETLHTPDEQPSQIHIKARFISVPHGTLANLAKYLNTTNHNDGKPMGLLSASEGKALLKYLAAQTGVETLGEPNFTVLSGRQVQLRATETTNAITHLAGWELWGLATQTNIMETGERLELLPTTMPNGYAINLRAVSSFTTASPLQTRQLEASVNVWDNQTVLLTGMLESHAGEASASESESKSAGNDVLVIITSTLVDAAGFCVHSDTDLVALPPVPPQPE